MHVFVRRLVCAVALAAAGSSCVFAVESKRGGESASGGAEKELSTKGSDSDAKTRAKARKAEKREHELMVARRELEIAELEAQAETRSASEKLDAARRELEEAQRALEHFKSREAPRQLADARLDLDRATQRRFEAEQELREMEATYAKDQFAKDTKELVLTRHRKQLEFATRELELAEQIFADKEKVELPREQREHEKKVRDAEQELREAEVGLQKRKLAGELELAKKRFELHELERPLDEDEDEPGESKGKD